MSKSINILVLFIFLFLGSFTVESQSKYTENKSINSLLRKKRLYNEKNGTGFRIQLYNGNERRARSIKENFLIKFPYIYSKLKYEAPEWKVHVGRYQSKIEADKELNKIREKFSGAIVIPL
ncbi:SPOR domain-containing protein [Tenacibaculum amylolyticum]|uniref:SPOR domain-containing protein n=1 Tax=Tenacibaculum amylolyticum TaxID=104269 RepID=UPI003895BB1E